MTLYRVTGHSRWPADPPFNVIDLTMAVGDSVDLTLSPTDEQKLIAAGLIVVQNSAGDLWDPHTRLG